jgi:hypothetical protein
MEHCRAKRGFFSLRDCGEMAVKQCALCGRPMCAAHLSPQSGFSRCLDCEGRQAEQQVLHQPKQQPKQPQQAAAPPDQPLNDPSWSYRYRDRYYTRSGYAPIYAGTYYDSYYDRYDTRSFDSDMASRGPATAAEREGGTGLGDS